jgi:trk system potassium uptake protein TrkH
MNYRLVINQLGLLQLVLSIIMLLMAAGFFAIELALNHKVDSQARAALMLSGGIGLAIGLGAWFFTRSPSQNVGRRDAILLVGMTWVLGAAFSALPYFFWAGLSEEIAADHPFHSFTDCYFEAMSGLTTTGATVLTDIEAVPRSLLLWRSLTQWLGGLGIVVLFVAVLPALGTSARKMFRAEVSGITKQGVRPQIRDTARVLWVIYVSLTVAQILALRLAGMDWFDSICHTFTTLATGGFSTKNASIAAWHSPLIHTILIVFMILGGVNFALYYQAIRGRLSSIYKDPEFRLYIALLLVGSAVIASLVYGRSMLMLSNETVEGTALASFQHAAFTVVSIQTTTGYATAEYDNWPSMATALLFGLGFIGGCAGSTSGGLKVIRIWIIIKTLQLEFERAFRPSVVRSIRVGDAPIGEEVRLATAAFFAAFVGVIALAAVALMVFESEKNIDSTSAISAAIACMCTIGPGLNLFGGIENYGWLSPWSKWLLSFVMLVGRLEVFTILVLLAPRFWRNR